MTSRVIAALACGAVLLGGCSAPAQQAPSASSGAVRVTSCGMPLTFAESPQRVVTLDQTSTETLLALGLADRMAGTSNLKTRVAPQFAADYRRVKVLSPGLLTSEQLRAANPDFVVASFADQFTRDRVGTREELHELGVPTFVSAVDCPTGDDSPFDRLHQDYRTLGRIFGVTERAERLIAEQQKAIGKARSLRARNRPTVLWLYSVFNDVPYVAGGIGIPAAMSEILGVRNAFDDVGQQWPEVSWEQIAAREPDVIVVGDLSERGAPGDSAEEKIAQIRQHPVMSRLDAVRHNRFVTVSGIELDPSVRSHNALTEVAQALADMPALAGDTSR